MKKLKNKSEYFFIVSIIAFTLFFTTISVKSSPYLFCRFICWMGECEDKS